MELPFFLPILLRRAVNLRHFCVFTSFFACAILTLSTTYTCFVARPGCFAPHGLNKTMGCKSPTVPPL